MKILNFNKFIFTAALVLGCSASFAQTGVVDKPVSAGAEQGVNDAWRPSLVNDGSYDRVKHVGIPIPWQYVREADVLWKKKVWREIDTREKQNLPFRYAGDEQSGGGMFIEILLDGVKRGKIPAYSTFGGTDDRFTTKLTKEQIMDQVAGTLDSIPVTDPVNNTTYMQVVKHEFNPASVTKFRLKEEWLFDRNQGKMVCHIIGIAPVKDVYDENNQYRGSTPMFWLYYPEIRQTLSNYEVFNPQNDVYRYTWDEFFEARQFSSKITKVSNPLDQRFEDIYGSNDRGKMEALYESQQTATEIFNKEHDMWVY